MIWCCEVYGKRSKETCYILTMAVSKIGHTQSVLSLPCFYLLWASQASVY